jgi:hypothetical protein
MPTYEMQVVCQVLTITADTEEEAEIKYEAHFGDGDCPCGNGGDCDCVDDREDCYHLTEKIGD